MPDAIRLAVLGAGGRMGRAVVAAALDDPRFRLTAAHSRSGAGEDAAVLAGRAPCGIAVGSELAAVVEAADVVVDFTRPELAARVAGLCAESGRALVSGTTGMEPAQRAALEAAGKTVPVFWAPNMSVGVNLLLAALADVASRAGEEFDVEIIEAHHRRKVDAPSGTAIALGEAVAAARGRPLEDIADHGPPPSVRERGRIRFHSLRAGEIVGEHDVRLVSAGEEIRLGHSAFSREAFAAGALRAAAWLAGRAPGFYGMRELLDLPAN